MCRKNVIQSIIVATGLLAVSVHAESLGLADSAFIRSGTNADTAQGWGTALALKNAEGNNGRIAMMKANLSSITGTVETATFSLYAKDDLAHTIYVYGVKETATFEDWTGDDTGNATWNSVTSGGLFTPQEDLHLTSDPNLVLLGTNNMSGTASDVLISVSGSALVDLINNDADDLLTFVFTIDANINSAIRPHNHANAPSLEYSYAGVSTEFQHPLYGDAAQLYSNAAPYDLTQETYTFSTLWSKPVQDSINFLPQSYHSPIVTRGDSTFVLFVDTDHRMKIAQLTNGVLKAEAVIDDTLYQPDEFYANYDADPDNDVTEPSHHTVKFDDSHHSVALGIDENGYLHLVGDMHNYPRYESPQAHLPLRYAYKNIMYWRSDNPLDISSFSFKGDQAGQCPPGFGFTYQVFFNDLNGKLHFTARAHQTSSNAVRCAPFSRYDAGTGTWSAIGGPDPDDPGSEPRTFYDDGREYTTASPDNKYSKTHPHGVFDRNNTMHLVAPMLKDPTLHPGDPMLHFADTIMYAQSTNGTDFTKANGSAITLPATINLTTNQADIAYSTTGYLAVMGNMAVDYQNNPYTVAKEKYLDGSNQSFVIGWNGTTWANYGEIVNLSADFRLVHDPAGVMSYIPDSADQFYRFWHPTDTLHQVNLPVSWPYIKMVDYEYLKKTGNIMGLSKIDGELTVVKVVINNRPGMTLIDPPVETPANNPPEITTPASATGNTLSVAATDADGDSLTFTWSKSYGPGNVTFSINGTVASSNTTASFSQTGTYELKVAVSDGIETRVSTCYLLATSSGAVYSSFQIGGLDTERNAGWNNMSGTPSTGTYSFADTTDPDLVFTITAVAGSGDALNLNSTHLGVDSTGRQADENTGRITQDESILLTLSYVDPSNSLASLEISKFGPTWGNGATETTVFTDASANSTNIVAFNHNIADNLIDYAATGLDALTKFNPPSWSMTVSVDHSRGTTASGMGGLMLTYVVDPGGNNTPTPYFQWSEDNGLTSGVNDGYGDDPESDGMNNLLEYALGGHPLIDDAGEKLPRVGTGEEGGTNWLNYVYRRRLDATARNLIYDVLATDALVSNVWTTDTEEAVSVILDSEFEAVTNRVSTDTESQQFMKLEIGITE